MLQIELINRMTNGGLGTSGMLRFCHCSRICLPMRASSRNSETPQKKGHGVQALACRLGPLENGSHKLKLELHAFFHSFRASQRDMKAPQNSYPTPGILPTCTSASELQSDATLEASQTQAAAQRMRRRPNPNYGFSRVF